MVRMFRLQLISLTNNLKYKHTPVRRQSKMSDQRALLLGVAIFSSGVGALLATLLDIIRHEVAKSNFDYLRKDSGYLKKTERKVGSDAA